VTYVSNIAKYYVAYQLAFDMEAASTNRLSPEVADVP
jgi:hypothetical protein